MSLERAIAHLARFGLEDRIQLFQESSATVELAAHAVGCEPAHIAKTLSFRVNDAPVLIVAAGDAKINNSKFKAQFHTKAVMLPFEEWSPWSAMVLAACVPLVSTKTLQSTWIFP